jgi:hypothetical protein
MVGLTAPQGPQLEFENCSISVTRVCAFAAQEIRTSIERFIICLFIV